MNTDLIETIEACPDTTITLLTKRKFVVANSLEDVIDQIVAFRQRCADGANPTVRLAIETSRAHDHRDEVTRAA